MNGATCNEPGLTMEAAEVVVQKLFEVVLRDLWCYYLSGVAVFLKGGGM